ncbi:hypothetical protein MTO96_048869 [Rhipicephalus appendiculatus]
MSDKAGEKPGPRKSRSRSLHKGRGKGSTSKESGKRGSASGVGSRRLARRHKSSIARHGSGSLLSPATDTAAKTDAAGKRGSTQASTAKHHRASGAWHSMGGGSRKKSLVGLHSALERRVEEFSSREVQAIRARCGRVAIGVTVAVVIVVIVATVVSVTWFVSGPKAVVKPSAMRGYALIAHLTAACSTERLPYSDGHAEQLRRSLCKPVRGSYRYTSKDVYKYTCGKWHAVDDDGRPMSYEQNVRFAYANAVDSKLVGNTTANSLCRSSEPLAKMGCIYASCVAFYTNRSSSLQDLFTAAKIDPSEWMRTKDPQSMFFLVIRKIVDTGLVSVLNITKRDTNTAVVEVGTCISCSPDDGDSFLKFLLGQAVSIKVVDSASVERLSKDLLGLDKLLKQVPPAPKGAAVVDAGGSMFDKADRNAWTQALSSSEAGFSPKSGGLKILSSNSKGVGKVVEALSGFSLEVGRLYTLLAPVAPYVAVERWQAGRRASTKAFEAKTKCLNNMGFLFPVPFDTAVATFLGAQKAAVTFNSLWSSVRIAGVNALHLGKGLDLDKNALMAASIGIRGTSGLDDPTFGENYDDDFLANLVRYVRHSKRQLRPSDFRSDSPDKGGFLPTKYFSPDYYYKGATETTINSGTLGSLTASMLFRMSFPHLASEPGPYIKCLTNYSRSSLKLDLNEADWRKCTRVRWAVEVALAATQQDTDQRHRRELDAMHYLRFARAYCGEEERDRMPLKFAALSSADFNETFECNYPYPVIAC